ncbi:hypothetical protein Bca52824_065957 [Brassica carinata]|uniref:Uncharacterized protein n=1 Tax=Brassica carinata TaxID=52824 RepID=A0A8X7QJQ1_BRACI|nr:hypothetical protein Bca52824_065957 [Brassica carinata]
MLTLCLKRDVNVRVSRLVLKATSGTHIYFDSETAARKEEFDNSAHCRLTGDGTDQTASSLKLEGAQVPEASQPEVVATGSDVKVDNTSSVRGAIYI